MSMTSDGKGNEIVAPTRHASPFTMTSQGNHVRSRSRSVRSPQTVAGLASKCRSRLTVARARARSNWILATDILLGSPPPLKICAASQRDRSEQLGFLQQCDRSCPGAELPDSNGIGLQI